VAAKVDEERGRIAAAEAKKAKRLVAIDVDQKVKQIADLNDVLRRRDAKLAEAQQAQADLIRKRRELDDAKREMDLTIQKQVQAELGVVRDQAKQEAEAALTLRVREKEEQIASMQRQIEDLRRKAEQGSRQLQGEVQELALEALLRQKFPHDVIEPVPKGEFGGDLIQRVVGPAGQICGSILWEAKRTKNWADGWLGKVRDDQRAAKADMALIVSHALPKGLQTFDQIDGVWVTEPRCAVAVAIALRESLIALAAARLAGEGQQTKMELVYQYLTGSRFRHRIEAVVERFSDMQADLDRETMMRLWAKREEQIRGVVESTAGLYCDLQGIAGAACWRSTGWRFRCSMGHRLTRPNDGVGVRLPERCNSRAPDVRRQRPARDGLAFLSPRTPSYHAPYACVTMNAPTMTPASRPSTKSTINTNFTEIVP
jgi:hypothetical protein